MQKLLVAEPAPRKARRAPCDGSRQAGTQVGPQHLADCKINEPQLCCSRYGTCRVKYAYGHAHTCDIYECVYVYTYIYNICIYLFMRSHVYMCVYIYTYAYTCMFRCTRTHTQRHTHAHTHENLHVSHAAHTLCVCVFIDAWREGREE